MRFSQLSDFEIHIMANTDSRSDVYVYQIPYEFPFYTYLNYYENSSIKVTKINQLDI